MIYINEEKLEQCKINKNNICYIIDFDRTLTKENCEDFGMQLQVKKYLEKN